jgi:signal transduction histidine kinase
VSDRNERGVLSRQLAKRLLPLSLVIGFIIAVVIPGVYGYLGYVQLRNDATTYGGTLAFQIRRLVADAPELWKFQATKYSQIIETFVPHREIVAIGITDEKGAALRQYEHQARGKGRWQSLVVPGRPAAILFNNRKIGEITITLSARELLRSCLAALLVCGLLGLGLAWLAYFVPLRVTEALEGMVLEQQRLLETQVSERTAALQETTRKAMELSEQARRANEAKSEFLANMSHELRTPLNHIIGFTELVVDRRLGELNEQQAEFLDDVLQSGRHLLSLINEILDLSKVEAGKMELELATVSLDSFVGNSLVMVKEKALKHRIRLTTELAGIPETIRADERKLKQILYNLLSNAVKFTPDGGSIRVEVASAPGAGAKPDAVRFSVIDSGIGIAAGDLERIFEPFEQADGSASRKFQGSGLGLTLTRKLVDLHGGRIWAESDGPGKGSRFHFTLPLEPDAAAQTPG